MSALLTGGGSRTGDSVRQDKSAACGLAYVVGRVGFFDLAITLPAGAVAIKPDELNASGAVAGKIWGHST